MKKYQAGSTISLTLTLGKGKYLHIKFDSMSSGNSVYSSNSKAIQEAIENTEMFKSGYITIIEDTEAVVKKSKVEVNPKAEYKEVSVASWDDAKAYLVENLGISPSKVRTQSTISSVAEANNIHFIF